MLRTPSGAPGCRRLHDVPQAGLPGVRDAVGRHLSLHRVPGGAARPARAALARGRLDLRRRRLRPPPLSERAADGVGGRADRGTVLIRAPLSTTSVLDEMSDAVALAAVPWAGVLVLTSLPYYFLQVLFLERLAEVGSAASHYGRALGVLANWTLLAFVAALWGRAV